MAGDDEGNPGPGGDRRPVPDPTVLTTEALARETNALRRELAGEAGALRREIEWQRSYFKQEIDLLREIYSVKIDAVIQTANDRFDRVKDQFAQVENQREEQKSDTQKAVDAALAAQKEAVREQTIASQTAIAKSEAAISKQLDQQGVTASTVYEGLRRADGDLEKRIGRMENQKLGGEAKVGSIYALGGFILVILLILGAVLAVVN